MNKMVKRLLPILLIFLNTINVSAITYDELEKEQKETYNALIESVNTKNINDFIEILATGKNFELTNVNQPNLVKLINNIDYDNQTTKKENFIYTLFLYGMLDEVVLQVENKIKIKRFKKIYKTLNKYLENSTTLSPKIVKQILASERNRNDRQTSFFWYLTTKVIDQNKILNTSFQKSINWFSNKISLFIWNKNIEGTKKIIEMVPFTVIKKRQNLDIKRFSKENLSKEEANQIIEKIEEMEKQFSQREPSAFTALFRYSWF